MSDPCASVLPMTHIEHTCWFDRNGSCIHDDCPFIEGPEEDSFA